MCRSECGTSEQMRATNETVNLMGDDMTKVEKKMTMKANAKIAQFIENWDEVKLPSKKNVLPSEKSSLTPHG